MSVAAPCQFSIFKRMIVLVVLIALAPICVYTQNVLMQNTPVPGSEPLEQSLDELEAVTFEGCVLTSPEQLVGVIESRESELSTTRRLALYYYENLKRNPSTPEVVMQTLTAVQRDLRDELRYFEPRKAADDSVALEIYLHQNGFHNGRVSWRYWRDHVSHKNTLTFTIEEGPRAVIDTIIWIGLDSLAPEVKRVVDEARKIKLGDFYSEGSFESELRNVVRALQDNGYYRARYEPPVVAISANGQHDSILAVIRSGPRGRISQILFEENENGYPSVNESTRKRQLEFSVGDWYNLTDLERSRANLMQLGVFEVAVIDTLSVNFVDSTGRPMSDSNVSVRIFTKNSKNYDVGANFLFFQTAVDNYLNAGVGVTAQYRNVFGGAQVASATMQYILQDVSRAFQKQEVESEALASVVLAWPNIARVLGARVALQTNVYYSLRLLIDPFRLESFGFGVRAPVTLRTFTYFNGLDVNIGLERQVPKYFEGAINIALDSAKSKEDTAYVLSTFNQFIVLDEYLEKTGNFFTGIYAGLNLRGEHRDNPVDPTRGTFTSIATEYGWGAGDFVRVQLFNTSVIPLRERLVFATKVKLGHIQLLEFTHGSAIDTNTYVPLERQFFSGGAASIRSYPSRLLHDPNSGVLDVDDPNTQEILSNVIGSGTLIELGFELRFKLPRPTGLDDLWASIVERSGFTLFTDIGNAFNRLTVDKYSTMQLQDLWLGSVVATGVGYRFDTPVGPFRIDYATSFYDPLRDEGKFIFGGRENVMSFNNWQLSIGLGHAF